MGEVLGLGLSHHPGLMSPDSNMADILRRNLERPDVPDQWKDRANWPAVMNDEYGDDGGTAAATRHRNQFVGHLRHLRAELDAFNPDFLVVWGDDQYENFREDVVPSFCVYAWDDITIRPHAPRGERQAIAAPATNNPWNEPADKEFIIRGKREAGKYMARELLGEKIDTAYSYERLHFDGLSHAFARIPLYLDYDRKGFDYPMIPIAVNCYGSRVLVNRGGSYPVGKMNVPEGDLDPPGPSPDRCMDMGAAVARAITRSPWRVAVIASSSWSHAFLTPKHYFMYPDMDADRWMYERLKASDYDQLHQHTVAEIEDAGQQEVLNWYCLAGAMEELGRKPDYIEFVETHIFNSNKCFAVYKP